MQKTRPALFGMMLAFFVIGYMSAFNDILMPDFRITFDLTYFQMTFVSFSFFIAYGVLSFPMGKITESIGFRWGIVVGFLLNILGCLTMLIAIEVHQFFILLSAIFIIAAGVVMLLVSAMPFTSLLGNARTSSARLSFVEVFHSLGSTVAPLIGGWAVFHALSKAVASSADPHVLSVHLQHIYVIMMLVLVVLVAVVVSLPMPLVKTHVDEPAQTGKAIFNRAVVFCAIVLFLYVGAEVTIGGFMISDSLAVKSVHLTPIEASKYVSLYWFLLLIGRLLGSFLLRYIETTLLITLSVVGAIMMVSLSFMLTGILVVQALVAVGLFNAILFPCLYSTGLGAAKKHEAMASGVLAIGITGGAFIPIFQGYIADEYTLRVSYVVPLACFVLILFYSLTMYFKKTAKIQQRN